MILNCYCNALKIEVNNESPERERAGEKGRGNSNVGIITVGIFMCGRRPVPIYGGPQVAGEQERT